jgi:hypothetical protein
VTLLIFVDFIMTRGGQKNRVGVDKKTETRSNPQNPKNKIKIWAVYNVPRVSGLKNLVSIGLVWASPGGGNWTDSVRNPST